MQNLPEEIQEQLVNQAKRNEAIASLMNFKKYIPSERVRQDHEERYKFPLKWFHLPGVGKYNSFELKFHSDWNWLVSACIEFKKYQYSNPKGSALEEAYKKILNFQPIDLNLETLWVLVSDYALLVTSE